MRFIQKLKHRTCYVPFTEGVSWRDSEKERVREVCGIRREKCRKYVDTNFQLSYLLKVRTVNHGLPDFATFLMGTKS